MTYLSYANIVFSDIHTKTFEAIPRYTPDGTTYLHDEITIGITAVFAKGLLPGIGNETPAQTWARIRGCLSKPRCQLTYKDGATTLINSPALGFTVDANNGPIPGQLSVTELTPGSYIVEWEVKTYIYACCNGSSTLPYTAHRWSESVTIDERMISTFTRRGKMFFRSDLLALNAVTADNYRPVIVSSCPLRPGHIRHSDYKVQEDGLAIEYTIFDQEQYAMPLPPAVKFEAEYRCTTQKGAVFIESMHVKVWGNIKTSKGQLYDVVNKIALSRLTGLGQLMPAANPGGAPTRKMIKSGYVADRLHENYVEAHWELFDQARATIFAGLQIANQGLLDPPNAATGGVNDVPDPGSYGTETILLVNAVLQDPCLNAALDRRELQAVGFNPPAGVDTSLTPAVINQVPLIAALPNNIDVNAMANTAYVAAKMDISYQQHQHILQMPVASSKVKASSMVSLANPSMTKTVVYEMESANAQPQLPATVSDDPNEVLISFAIVPSAVSLEADGQTPTYRVCGKYIYGLKEPQEKCIAGKLPYVNIDYSQTEIVAGQFITGLSSPSSPGSSVLRVT